MKIETYHIREEEKYQSIEITKIVEITTTENGYTKLEMYNQSVEQDGIEIQPYLKAFILYGEQANITNVIEYIKNKYGLEVQFDLVNEVTIPEE